MATLGETLRAAREGRGLTLRDVEAATDISNGYLSQLEANQIKAPSPKHLIRLGECLSIPYEKLMRLAGYVAPRRELAPKQRGLIERVSDFSDAELADIERYAEFLRSRREADK